MEEKPAEKIQWQCYELTPDSPEEEMASYFADAHESFKTYGKVGDTVHVKTLFGEVEGVVIELAPTGRSVKSGRSVWFQQWCHGKYWYDIGGGNLDAILKMELGPEPQG